MYLKIMELKEKQDADYFLYNLLLKPFQKIEKLDTNIPYDFHISQKKKFN